MDKQSINEWIATLACTALAELSSLYDETGKEAQALMCDWAGDHSGAGETAARRVVTTVTDIIAQLKTDAYSAGYHAGRRDGA